MSLMLAIALIRQVRVSPNRFHPRLLWASGMSVFITFGKVQFSKIFVEYKLNTQPYITTCMWPDRVGRAKSKYFNKNYLIPQVGTAIYRIG